MNKVVNEYYELKPYLFTINSFVSILARHSTNHIDVEGQSYKCVNLKADRSDITILSRQS